MGLNSLDISVTGAVRVLPGPRSEFGYRLGLSIRPH